MNAFVKFLIFGAVIGLAVLAEDFIARGMGVGVFIAAIISAYVIGDHTERRESLAALLFSMGYVLAVLFLILTLVLEVHVDDNGNVVNVHSRFYTHCIASGKKVEVKHINYAYSTEYGFIDGVESDDFYFVYTDHETCIIVSKYARVLEIGKAFALIEKDFGGDGNLQFIVDTDGEIYDFNGNRVDKGYLPIKVEHGVRDPVL